MWNSLDVINNRMFTLVSSYYPYSNLEGGKNAYWMAKEIQWQEIALEVGKEADYMVDCLVQSIAHWGSRHLLGYWNCDDGSKPN